LRILKGLAKASRASEHFGCRDIDPVEDTESASNTSRKGAMIYVAGISIRLRILKDDIDPASGQPIAVAGISIRLRILKE